MKKLPVKKIIYSLIILLLFIFLFFNEYGLLNYLTLKSDVSKLKREISETELELKQLKAEIDSVKTNLFKIEKIARENYYMLDSNEQAIKIEKKESN
jgi:cell division protein FtsB